MNKNLEQILTNTIEYIPFAVGGYIGGMQGLGKAYASDYVWLLLDTLPLAYSAYNRATFEKKIQEELSQPNPEKYALLMKKYMQPGWIEGTQILDLAYVLIETAVSYNVLYSAAKIIDFVN